MKVNHVIVAIFNFANMSFKAIRDNKILAKISEFTVSDGMSIASSVVLQYFYLRFQSFCVINKYL